MCVVGHHQYIRDYSPRMADRLLLSMAAQQSHHLWDELCCMKDATSCLMRVTYRSLNGLRNLPLTYIVSNNSGTRISNQKQNLRLRKKESTFAENILTILGSTKQENKLLDWMKAKKKVKTSSFV